MRSYHWYVTVGDKPQETPLPNAVTLQDQRVSFPKPVKEYDFDFTLNQDVHALRKKLHRAKGIIEGMLRIVAALSSHAREIHDLRDSPDSIHDRFTREMANVLRDIQSHQSTTNVLLNHLADIKSTVCIVTSIYSSPILHPSNLQARPRKHESDSELRSYM